MRSKKPRRPVPPTLLHRTLVFPLGRAGPRPEAPRNAHAFHSHSAGYGGIEHSGARNRPCGATQLFEWVAEASKGFGGGGVRARKPPKGRGPWSRTQTTTDEGGVGRFRGGGVGVGVRVQVGSGSASEWGLFFFRQKGGGSGSGLGSGLAGRRGELRAN